ncbi:MAG: filamentous hemagglutinin family outer membrane protein [Rickettsiaceae bacterium]|jgi:filamentous hemagglutinin family protein|nr:filamentous hemagglutinin family outer membrane protein [Rickettsiaceae bacterium]
MLRILNSFICLLLSSLLVLQPFVANAQVVVDTSIAANAPKLDVAPNGVPVVNIVSPTAGGVSKNTFTDFNVGQEGLILNNSLVLGVSQLGGALLGNPNFTTGKSAKIILNEVTGTNRSNLLGATEIFGSKAEYVLANPNGITCNGCGFINTPRVTLTTGLPQMSGGNLTGFDVEGGDVLFEGLDVNALNVDSFDIITRTAKLTSAIYAGDELNVITGRNNVDYATRTATAKADNGSAKPALAIDSAALGGMYAGKIGLVSTEAGVGVKTDGTLAASASDVVITADGRIEYKNVNAKQNIKVSGKGIKQSGDAYAGKDIEINSQEEIDLQDGFTAAGGDVNLFAHDDINNFNMVLSGVDAQNLGNDVTFSSNGLGSVLISAGGNLNNNGFISASDALLITATTFTNADLVQSGGYMQIAANTIDNSNSFIMDADGNIINGIVAGGDLDISGNLNNNNGAVVAGGLLSVTGDINNASGLIVSTDALTLTSNTITNTSGNIIGGSAIFNAATIDNTSGLLSAFGDMVINATTAATNYLGTIYAEGDLTAKNVSNNEGVIQTEGDIVLTNNGTALNNNLGNIRAVGSDSTITVSGVGDLLNLGGIIQAQSNIDLNINNNYTINGDIATNDHIDITAWSVTNNADVQAVDYILLTLTQGGFTNSSGAKLISNTSVAIDAQSGNIINNGEISGPVIDITAGNGNLTNSSAGIISSASTLDIEVSGAINNAGRISSLAATTIDAATLSNTGQIASDDTLTITTTGNSIHNTNGGLLYASNDLTLHTTDLTNTNSDIFSLDGDITIDKTAGVKNASVTNTSGTIQAMIGNIRIDTNSLTNNRSYYATVAPHRYDSNGNIIVYSGVAEGSTPYVDFSGYDTRNRIDFNDSAHNTYYIYRVHGSNAAAASILAGNDININAINVLNDAGVIAADNDITIIANSIINQARIVSDWAYVSIWRDSHPGWYGTLLVSDYNPEAFASYNLQSAIAPASIIAGNNLTGNVTNLNNAQSGSNGSSPVIYAQSGNTLSSSATPTVNGLAIEDGATAYSNSAALDTSLFANLPTDDNGLFKINTVPGSNYLVETNINFINLNRFMGSDYFLTRIGYVLPNGTKLLGDAFYETRLVSQAIFERTGQRYLASGIGTDFAQMQMLMDNAFTQMAGLSLQVGIELTPTQIASLNSDIMWLVEDEINGQKVLKPVIYLAQATLDALNGQGSKIIAGNNATLVASNKLVNSGLILAGNDITLAGQNELLNSGKIKAGRDITMVSTNGNVSNVATIARGGSGTYVVSSLQAQGEINAGRDASLTAGGDINNTASNITTGNDLAMTAGGSINITTDALHNHTELHAKKRTKIDDTVKHVPSNIKSGGDVALDAINDVNIIGSNLQGENGSIVSQVGNVNIKNAVDSVESYTATKKKGFLSSKSDKVFDHQETAVESNVAFNNNLSIDAELGDLNIQGSNLDVKNNLNVGSFTIALNPDGSPKINPDGTYQTISGGSVQNVNITAAELHNVHWEEHKKSGFNLGKLIDISSLMKPDFSNPFKKPASSVKLDTFKIEQTSTKTGTSNTQLHASNVNVGGNLTVNATENLTIAGSNASVGGNANINADKVDIKSAAQSDSSYSKEKKVVLGETEVGFRDNSFKAGVKGTGEEHKYDEQNTTQQSSNLTVGGNLLINSHNDVTIAASNVSVGGDADVKTGGNFNLVDASDTQKTNTENSKLEVEVGVKVGNAYVDVGFAAKALVDAQKALSDANKKLEKMKDLKEQGRASQKAVDLAYTQVAMAATGVATATTSLALATAGAASAASTSYGTGMYGAVYMDTTAHTDFMQTDSSQSVGSTFIASNNINIAAAGDYNMIGSQLASENGDVTISATEANIKAGENTYENQSGSKTVTAGVSYGNNAVGMHAGYSQSDNYILSNTHTNSEITAKNGTFSLTTGGDTNIRGGNITADHVALDIGGDLNLETLQDTYEQQGSSFGISIAGGKGSPAYLNNASISLGATDIYSSTTGRATGIMELASYDSSLSEADNLSNLLKSPSVNVAGNIDNQTVKEDVNFTDADFQGTITVPVNLFTEKGRAEVKEAFVNFDNNLATVGTHIAKSAENVVDSIAGTFNGENKDAGVLDTLADKQIAQTTSIARSRDNRARDTLTNTELGQSPDNIQYALGVGSAEDNEVYSNENDGDFGFYDTQNKQGYVNLGENALNGEWLIFTDAHETAHGTSDSEAYANMIGGGAVSSWNTFSSINNDYYQSGYNAANYGIRTADNSYYQPTQAQYNYVYNPVSNSVLNRNTVAANAVPESSKDHNTVMLGGAGEESETKIYMTALQDKFKKAGVVQPEYIPISQGGKVPNVINTVLNVNGNIPYVVSDDIFRYAPVSTIVDASNDEGGQRNIVGYSYGSVMGANAALQLANQGIYVDNVALVGSPISSNSALYNDLKNNKNIGNVVRFDISNDPLSNGINLDYFVSSDDLQNNSITNNVITRLPDRIKQGLDAHFYYINNNQNQQDTLSKSVAEDFNKK